MAGGGGWGLVTGPSAVRQPSTCHHPEGGPSLGCLATVWLTAMTCGCQGTKVSAISIKTLPPRTLLVRHGAEQRASRYRQQPASCPLPSAQGPVAQIPGNKPRPKQCPPSIPLSVGSRTSHYRALPSHHQVRHHDNAAGPSWGTLP